jgi:carboxypeptidase family protein
MGTTYRALLVCLLLLAVSSAQEPQTKEFKIEGVVVNSVTGKPLPRVLVQVNERSLLTGPEGEFSFDAMPAGRIQFRLTKPGYFTPGTGFNHWSPTSNNFDVGPDTGKILLKLAPEAVIFGRVTGQDEEPLEGASVQVLAYVANEGRQYLSSVTGEERADEDGNFRIAGLSAGRYYLAVKAGNVTRRVLGAQTPKSPEAYPAIVYYPGTRDQAAMGALDLAPGQKMEAAFSLALLPAYRVAGRVVAAGEWKQINSPMIVGALDQPLFSADEFDAQSGAFVFRAIPAGTYTLRVSGMDQENRYGFSNHKVIVARSMADLKFALQPGINIPVTVRSEFNKPLQRGACLMSGPGGQQSDCSDHPAASVELVSVDSVRSRFSTTYPPMKDASDFGVHGVVPGTYVVRARPAFGGYVQSVRSGALDLLRQELTVPEEGSVAPIEVVLRDDPGMLQVTLPALRPGQVVMVLVFPSGALLATPNQTAVSTSNVSFGTMAPGTYSVFAFDPVDGLDYYNPEVLAKYASKAATVTITANGNASVVVDVIHVGE